MVLLVAIRVVRRAGVIVVVISEEITNQMGPVVGSPTVGEVRVAARITGLRGAIVETAVV